MLCFPLFVLPTPTPTPTSNPRMQWKTWLKRMQKTQEWSPPQGYSQLHTLPYTRALSIPMPVPPLHTHTRALTTSPLLRSPQSLALKAVSECRTLPHLSHLPRCSSRNTYTSLLIHTVPRETLRQQLTLIINSSHFHPFTFHQKTQKYPPSPFIRGLP